MSSQLKRVLDAIRQDPFISQQALADQLGVSRSTIANQIAELTRSGKLLGRAYVLPTKQQVICVGGANQDRKLQLQGEFIAGSSLPVAHSFVSAGGVARNVAENLSRLGLPVTLSSVIGSDQAGRWLLEHCQQLGIDTSLCDILPGSSTGQYTAVLDQRNELAVALSEMSILDRMDLDWFNKVWPKLRSARYIFVDCNLPQPVLSKLLQRCHQHGISVAVDTVSASKALRLDGLLELIHLLTPNREEALQLTGLPDSTSNEQLVERLYQLGVNNIVLTLGQQGVLIRDSNGLRDMPAHQVKVNDVTGAGDALLAGIIAAELAGETFEQAVRWGQAAAAITLADDLSVSPNLSQPAILSILSEHN